ncbi:hypothetical protein GGI04_002948, partial [Coemansia thaxteri]
MATPNMPQEIQFQLRDDAQGLTHSATSVAFVFADDPMPLGSDDSQISIIVDMSEDGTKPVGVRSLSTSFMATGYEWNPHTLSDASTASLAIHGMA